MGWEVIGQARADITAGDAVEADLEHGVLRPAGTAGKHYQICLFRRQGSGSVCADAADWIVSVGNRKTDEQPSCQAHLGETCQIMAGSEFRPGVVLHIREA